MFNKLRSKPKDVNVPEKVTQSKKVDSKHHESSKHSSRSSNAAYSSPLVRKPVLPDSPMSTNHTKSSVESSYASIPSPNRIKSYISYNDSIDNRSITSDRSKNLALIERLKTEIQDLRLQYQNDVTNLRRENYELQLDLKKTKREMYDLMNEHNETLKKTVDQLDVEVRMLNKSIYDIQSHYIKFVPFLLNNFMLMMKNQEYLSNRIKQVEHPRSNADKIFQSQTSNYCDISDSCSCPYSIAISPMSNKDNYYKLVLSPVEELSISRFSKEVQDQIYDLPLIQEVSSDKTIYQSLPSNPGNNALHRKLVLGAKAVPYYLKKLNNTNNISVHLGCSQMNGYRCHRKNSRQSILKNVDNMDGEINIVNMNTSMVLHFKDLKRRNLKRKFRGLRRQSFPCIDSPTFGSDLFKLREGDSICGSNDDLGMKEADSNLLVCQSDTDLLCWRHSVHYSEPDLEYCPCQRIPAETVIYQQLPNCLIHELERLKIVGENDENESNRFSVILSRSKLSILLSQNVRNLTRDILSSDDNDDPQYSQNCQFKQKTKFQSIIDDSDYFTFISKRVPQEINLASVETLSDNASFIDDDYGQQVLIDQRNLPAEVYDSFDQLCCDLDHFSLPRSSVNNIFGKFTH